MKTTFSVQLLAAALPLVSAHGVISSPPPRLPGSAMKAACGEQVFNNQNSDNAGNVQGILQVASSQKDYNAAECNVWLCKGYKFDDNTANVQTYTPGQVVPIKVDIRAPHTGVANVSIVDTKLNKVIGPPLISFDDYASVAHTIPANNTQFSITMPQDLSACGEAGNCVIQWFWDAPSIKQTYEGCIDFKTGAGGSTPPAPAVSSVAPAVSSAIAAAPSAPSVPSAPAPSGNTTAPGTSPDEDGETCADEPEAGAGDEDGETCTDEPEAGAGDEDGETCTDEPEAGAGDEDGETCSDEPEETQSVVKRQVMESMTNGPKTTLGISAQSMSATPSATSASRSSAAATPSMSMTSPSTGDAMIGMPSLTMVAGMIILVLAL